MIIKQEVHEAFWNPKIEMSGDTLIWEFEVE
eukprot:CAMPEP_0204847578 /NCGR_PEP_ID=MMETSP1347-20130617/2864_1 /ASSEMBLY_ACC=CAM_ASM_000690 /TAXON_ID=215587 /ORGANISM="Aplanochytrium stocchinoi, Strain GSBS06" /LENGTH=30 /DNA_ID= /DNA_START= /DNA_END= /DNA_ORIENTATION=